MLEGVCDTYVPSVESASGDPIEREFLARSAGDMLVAAQIEGMLAETLLPEEIAQVAGLLDAIAGEGFLDADLAGRTALLLGLADADADAKQGLTQLKALTMLLFYGAPDETTGRNANWEAIGYPGPVSAAPSADEAPKTIELVGLSGTSETLDVRRGDRGLGRRRLGDRGGVRPRRQERAGARDGPVQERAGLQPARGAGLPGDVLRRRAGRLGERVDFCAGRPDAGRGHRCELHELHPHAGMEDAGESLSAVGLVISLHVGGMFIPSPVTGVLADRFGRIPVIAGGGVALIAAGAMAAVSPGDEVVLMAARPGLLGLGWNFGLVGGSALLTDAVEPERRAQTQGAADLVMGLTGVSGNLVAGPLFHAGAFGVLGLGAVAIGLGLILLAARNRPAVAAAT